jgi:hypothetical protein
MAQICLPPFPLLTPVRISNGVELVSITVWKTSALGSPRDDGCRIGLHVDNSFASHQAAVVDEADADRTVLFGSKSPARWRVVHSAAGFLEGTQLDGSAPQPIALEIANNPIAKDAFILDLLRAP